MKMYIVHINVPHSTIKVGPMGMEGVERLIRPLDPKIHSKIEIFEVSRELEVDEITPTAFGLKEKPY